MVIGELGHVTQHMRESTVHNQNKNNSQESETNTELSKSRWDSLPSLVNTEEEKSSENKTIGQYFQNTLYTYDQQKIYIFVDA